MKGRKVKGKRGSKTENRQPLMEKMAPLLEQLKIELESSDASRSERAASLKQRLVDDWRKKHEEFESLVKQTIEGSNVRLTAFRMQIPADVGNLTIGQIREAGGSCEVNGKGDYEISVPGLLYLKEFHKSNSHSKLVESAKKNVHNLSASKTKTTAKRLRVPSVGRPSPSTSTRHKIQRTQPQPSPAPLDVGNTSMMLRSTVRKTERQTNAAPTITKAKRTARTTTQSIMHSTMLEPGMSKSASSSASSMPPPSTTHVLKHTPGSKKSQEEQKRSNSTDIEVGIENLSLINPKTPSGNRLFKKPPRRMKPDEQIVICSKAGTPLLADEKKKKVISGDATKGLSDETTLPLLSGVDID